VYRGLDTAPGSDHGLAVPSGADGAVKVANHPPTEVTMEHLLRTLLRTIDRLGPTEWAVALGAAIVIGFVCMRGFGSRSNY